MILVVDNYDSFTFNLVQALEAAGAVVRVYLGRAEATQLAHSEIPACLPQGLSCPASLPFEVDVSVPVVVPGQVYTIAYYENFPRLTGSVPPGCRAYVLLNGSGQRCERTLNAIVAG